MRALPLLLCFVGGLFAEEAHAAPAPGRYTGVLKVTRRVLGVPNTVSVRAVAEVSSNGELSFALLTSPSPFPDKPAEVLRTTMEADGSCVIPRGTVDETAPAPAEASGNGLEVRLPQITPEYLGRVSVSGTTFSLTYDDIPDRFYTADGQPVYINYFVAPVPNAEYRHEFRPALVSPPRSPVTKARS